MATAPLLVRLDLTRKEAEDCDEDSFLAHEDTAEADEADLATGGEDLADSKRVRSCRTDGISSGLASDVEFGLEGERRA